jgi:hypothetical protein
MVRSKSFDLGEIGRGSPGFFVEIRKERNVNKLGYDRQTHAKENDQEQEEDSGQRDVGLLKLASRAIGLFVQYGIGVKKIDEGYEGEKIEQVDKKNFSDAEIFHEI